MTLPDGKAEYQVKEQASPDAATQDAAAQDETAHDEAAQDAASNDAGRKADASTSIPSSDATAVAGLDPFLAEVSAGKPEAASEAAAPRSFKGMMLDYSAHAAMIVVLIGFAWTVSDHVVTRPTAAQIEAPAGKPVKQSDASRQADMGKQADLSGQSDGARQAEAVAPEAAKRDDVDDLRAANRRMTSEIDALRAEIGTLHAALDGTPGQLRALTTDLERAKANLGTAKSESASAFAQLSSRIDKLQHDPNSKMQQLVDKLAKLEHESVDAAPTGSIAPSQAAQGKALPLPLPPVKPVPAKLGTDDGRKSAAEKPIEDVQPKPQVLAGWIVRDVYDGVALVEGRRGQIEVVPGVSIPGAGVVKSIDRHGNGWTVTTTKGLLAYAAPQQRDYRRGNARDAYPAYPYDF